MLSIPCPWCGERAQSEFTHGGDATVVRPSDPAVASAEAWHAYIYLRENRQGLHLEYWHHSHGCRRWFKVVRDTLSHEIHASGGFELSLPEGDG